MSDATPPSLDPKPNATNFLKLVIELTSIATIASFLLAALIQHLVFKAFGIPFLAIASLEDVARGGVRMLVSFVLFSMVLGVSLGAPYAVVRMIRGYIKAGLVGCILYFACSVAVAALCVGLAFWLRSDEMYNHPTTLPAPSIWSTLLPILIGPLLVIAMIISTLTRVANPFWRLVVGKHEYGTPALHRRLSLIVLAICLAITAVITVTETAEQISSGVGITGPMVASGNRRCLATQLIWIGSNYSVVRCRNEYIAVKDVSPVFLAREQNFVQ